ncbi:MAG: hypothetical protein M3P06_07535 [Acidobacteriota bacterium]|nr:hypothetical protein [Acidobacteriota bacterium]
MADQLTAHEEAQLKQLATEMDASRAEAVSIGDICTIWNKYKNYWPIIIKAAKLIPVFGGTIATFLEMIGNALDAFCAKK